MWNRGAVAVEVRHGPGMLISTFGGEGTGLKAMAACAWRAGEPVTFSVSGEPEGEGPAEAWRGARSTRWQPTGGRARGLATSALGPALLC